LEDEPLNPQEEIVLVSGDQFGNIMSVTKSADSASESLEPGTTIPYQASQIYYFEDGESSGNGIMAECHEYLSQLISIVREAEQYLADS
jgi:hypothetical protein